jgi:hypothetical protein
MKYVENLYDWAVGVYDEFCSDSYRIEEMHDYETGITIVYDLRTGKTAFSKCRKDEEFSEEIGVAVAYTRLKGGEVPRVLQKTFLKNLVSGEKFALSNSPKNTFYVVGVNPLKPTEIIVVDTKDGYISRFKEDYEIYKIN